MKKGINILHFLLFIFCFGSSILFANKNADSLRALIDKADNDTLKVNCWNKISMINSNEGRYSLAEKAGFEALDIAKRAGFQRGVADAYYQIGIAFSKQAKYDVSMEWYLKAVAEYEKLNNKSGLGFTYLLIGVIDYYLHNNDKAELNYKKAVKYFGEANDKAGKANVSVNLAYLYMEANKCDQAIDYAEKAYTLFKDGNSYHGMAVCKTCVASCYLALHNQNDTLGNKDVAYEYLERAGKAYGENVSIYKWLKMPTEITNEYLNLFEINFVPTYGNKEIAKQYLDSALKNVDQKQDARHAMVVYQSFYRWYLDKGDSLKAFNYYFKYTASKDSVFNAEKAEKLEGMSVQLAEFEKQKEIDLLTKEKEKRELILWGVGLLAVLAIAFSVLFFKRFRDKQSANLILFDKNRIIEDKNKEIIDSINYAKRIQQALLTSESELKNCFADVFVLYKPKDIVSGDFYWYAESEHNKILAVADCTGHGVPGAFMSMMGYEMLQDILLKENITTTAEALKLLDVRITETLNKSDKSFRDGMDMALCAFSKTKQSVQFSGANRPIIHFSNGTLTEYVPDKNTIGGDVDGTDKKYRIQDIAIKSGDVFYFFTDGYADQFGGNGGKKFKYKQLKEILQAIHIDPLEVQKQKLETAFETWKGSLEQVDDVCIIGIRI